MQQRFLIAALIFVLGNFLQVGAAQADALGLDDGTFNITLDFTDDSLDGAGTITVGPGFLTEVHVTVNSAVTSASFDCIGCAVSSPTGDSVLSNNNSVFSIVDDSGGLARLVLNGQANGQKEMTFVFAFSTFTGTWSVIPESAIPEPASLSLLGLGAIALFLRHRRQS